MRYCPVPGCLQLVEKGRCARHAIRRPHGRAWDRLRTTILRRDRTCTLCRQAPSTELDHVIPLALGGTNAPRNLRGVCSDCHAGLTREQRRGA